MIASPPALPSPVPPRAHGWKTHARVASIFLVLSILASGIAYPLFVTAVAEAIDPSAAGGSLLRCPNGTVVGSADIAQNMSAGTLGQGLFWARPSLTDYNTTLGAAAPPGPSDPALLALLNQTIAWMNAENATGPHTPTATLPFWWVAPSASSVDPDLTPSAVLVQIPRINNTTGLAVLTLMDLVDSHINEPPLPFLGVPFVNVLELDIALLALQGKC
jgi:potassium-transporting ATPase KdpC subunit